MLRGAISFLVALLWCQLCSARKLGCEENARVVRKPNSAMALIASTANLP